jgi:hypothetical protein
MSINAYQNHTKRIDRQQIRFAPSHANERVSEPNQNEGSNEDRKMIDRKIRVRVYSRRATIFLSSIFLSTPYTGLRPG